MVNKKMKKIKLVVHSTDISIFIHSFTDVFTSHQLHRWSTLIIHWNNHSSHLSLFSGAVGWNNLTNDIAKETPSFAPYRVIIGTWNTTKFFFASPYREIVTQYFQFISSNGCTPISTHFLHSKNSIIETVLDVFLDLTLGIERSPRSSYLVKRVDLNRIRPCFQPKIRSSYKLRPRSPVFPCLCDVGSNPTDSTKSDFMKKIATIRFSAIFVLRTLVGWESFLNTYVVGILVMQTLIHHQ